LRVAFGLSCHVVDINADRRAVDCKAFSFSGIFARLADLRIEIDIFFFSIIITVQA